MSGFSKGFGLGVAVSLFVTSVLPPVLSWLRRFLLSKRTQRCSRSLPSSAIYQTLCKQLFGSPSGPSIDPHHDLAEDHSYPYTNLPSELLKSLFAAIPPHFLVEVGSFKGGSALRIADAASVACAKEEVTPCLLCIDTFLGDAGMWLDRNIGWRDGLLLRHGHPQLFWQFLANTARYRNVILPLPVSSLCGLRALQHLALREVVQLPSFIYLDSAHEKGETLAEIRHAFHLLMPGGVLVGDDLDWPAVESDLTEFLTDKPAVFGSDDDVLGEIPGLCFSSKGYWVMSSSAPQWVLRKSAGGISELRRFVDAAENGEQPSEYTPIQPEDHEALNLYEDGLKMLEAGNVKGSSVKFKQAAALSQSFASHFNL